MRMKGYTIVELMVTIGVLGIILTIGIPSYRSYITRMKLNQAKDEILSTLRMAKTKAISEGNTYQVIFESATNTYRINNESKKTMPEGVEIANVSDVTYEFFSDGTGNVNPATVTIRNSYGEITFVLIEATGYIEVR